MVDKKLNYGRHHIINFAKSSKNVALSPICVDLGAGGGDDLMAFKGIFPTAKLVACESYEPYQVNLKSMGIEVFSCDIEHDRLPFENESVDFIIINQVLEHCKEIWWIMHEISRILKVGGKLIIGIPNLASMHNRFLLGLGKQPTSIQNQSAHVRGYTKKDFLKFLNCGFEGGYTLEDFGGSNFYPFPPLIAKPLAAIMPTAAWGIFFKFNKNRSYLNSFITYPIEQRLETKFYLGEI